MDDDDVGAFYERTVDDVYRYASRLAGHDVQRVEDIVQETYLTLLRQVRNGRTEPVDIGWAITTVRSRFLDQLRRDSRVVPFERAGFDESERSGTLVAGLADLPDAQRIAMILRYVDDLSVGEVAVAMERSDHAVESLLARGRAALRARGKGASDAG